jgi:hypothetical protein
MNALSMRMDTPSPNRTSALRVSGRLGDGHHDPSRLAVDQLWLKPPLRRRQLCRPRARSAGVAPDATGDIRKPGVTIRCLPVRVFRVAAEPRTTSATQRRGGEVRTPNVQDRALRTVPAWQIAQMKGRNAVKEGP